MHVQLEDRKLQHTRTNQLAGIVIALFVILIARLWYLQIACGDDLLKQSETNRKKLLRTRAPRGTILDRKNRVLATSRPQFVVMVTPDIVRTNKEAMTTLCSVLEMSPAELEVIMSKNGVRPGSPVRAKIDVTLDTMAKIGELRMKLPGVSVELDQIRFYPDGPAVAHIMGQLGEISEKQLDEAREQGKDYKPGDYIGKAGLEKQYEDNLRGSDGGKLIEVNAFGRAVRVLGEKASIPGKTLKLSIDRDLQIAAHRAMGNQVGAVVAVDTRTGGVLAMVSKPGYNPNIFVKKLKPEDWNWIIKNEALQNRCVYNFYPPGSTFKPMAAVAGLVYGECSARTTVSCPGCYYLGRHRYGCWKTHGGGVDFERAIAESCDVWFYKLAMRLGVDRLAEVVKQFGLSYSTGIDLPREERYKGIMPDTKWKRRRFHERWYAGETPSCGIGQGYVATSPLQMALACAGVANSGRIYRPYLLQEIQDGPDNKVVFRRSPEIRRTVKAPEDAFALVREAMKATVTKGTGSVCLMPDVTVGGKTGSAQNRGAAHAWFICFASVEKPEIAIACIVEHGQHGATAAAPVCRAILDVYFGKKKPSEIGKGIVHVSGD